MRVIFLSIASLFFFLHQATAQYDPAAKKLLDQARKTYEEMAAFETDFVYVMNNAAADVEETLKGHIRVMGDMFVLETGSQTIYNNQKRIWTYLPDVNEVTITDYTEDDTEVSPTTLLRKYEEGFKYIKAEPIDGMSVVDLTPEDKDQTYFRIRIFIDPDTKLVRKWVMSEKDGTKHTYTLKNFKRRSDLKASDFAFPESQHTDAEVIDLTEG